MSGKGKSRTRGHTRATVAGPARFFSSDPQADRLMSQEEPTSPSPSFGDSVTSSLEEAMIGLTTDVTGELDTDFARGPKFAGKRLNSDNSYTQNLFIMAQLGCSLEEVKLIRKFYSQGLPFLHEPKIGEVFSPYHPLMVLLDECFGQTFIIKKDDSINFFRKEGDSTIYLEFQFSHFSAMVRRTSDSEETPIMINLPGSIRFEFVLAQEGFKLDSCDPPLSEAVDSEALSEENRLLRDIILLSDDAVKTIKKDILLRLLVHQISQVILIRNYWKILIKEEEQGSTSAYNVELNQLVSEDTFATLSPPKQLKRLKTCCKVFLEKKEDGAPEEVRINGIIESIDIKDEESILRTIAKLTEIHNDFELCGYHQSLLELVQAMCNRCVRVSSEEDIAESVDSTSSLDGVRDRIQTRLSRDDFQTMFSREQVIALKGCVTDLSEESMRRFGHFEFELSQILRAIPDLNDDFIVRKTRQTLSQLESLERSTRCFNSQIYLEILSQVHRLLHDGTFLGWDEGMSEGMQDMAALWTKDASFTSIPPILEPIQRFEIIQKKAASVGKSISVVDRAEASVSNRLERRLCRILAQSQVLSDFILIDLVELQAQIMDYNYLLLIEKTREILNLDDCWRGESERSSSELQYIQDVLRDKEFLEFSGLKQFQLLVLMAISYKDDSVNSQEQELYKIFMTGHPTIPIVYERLCEFEKRILASIEENSRSIGMRMRRGSSSSSDT